MKTRVFCAHNAPAAFEQIRRRLGDKATILDVKRTAEGVKITASPGRGRVGRRLMEPVPVGPRPAREGVARRWNRPNLRVVTGPGVPAPLEVALEQMDFSMEHARRLGRVAGDGRHAWERLLGWLERTRPVRDPEPPLPGTPLCIGLVGPRGGGKSTLARGLAGAAAAGGAGSVVWVELGFPKRPTPHRQDLDIPLGVDRRIADSPRELRRVVEDHQHAALIVIDYPAIDLSSAGEPNAVARFVAATRRFCPRLSVHIVLSARWSTRESCRAIESLHETELVGIGWTFLDSVADPGTPIAVSMRTDMGPSFFHGDRRGDGSTSRSASWEELVDWMKRVSEPSSETRHDEETER